MVVQNGVLYLTIFEGTDIGLYSLDASRGGTPLLLGSIPTHGASNDGSDIVANATRLYWTSDIAFQPDGEVEATELDGGDPVTLASLQDGPVSPVLDSTNLYWAEYGNGSDAGGIWKAPLAGGAAVKLASADLPDRLAVDGDSVFWASGATGLYSVGLDGGPVTTLAFSVNPSAGLAIGGGTLYFGVGSSTDTTLEALSLATNQTTVLASNQSSPELLFLDGTTLYWTTSGTAVDGGSVLKLPLGCPAPIALATDQLYSSAATVDAASIYWAEGAGPYSIFKLPK